MRALRVYYLSNDVENKAWVTNSSPATINFLRPTLKKNGAVLGRAFRRAGWWVIFENILYHVAKPGLNHSGHERSIIKETKKSLKRASFTSFVATVAINVSQIFLNPPQRVFSNTFRRSSDRLRIGIKYFELHNSQFHSLGTTTHFGTDKEVQTEKLNRIKQFKSNNRVTKPVHLL